MLHRRSLLAWCSLAIPAAIGLACGDSLDVDERSDFAHIRVRTSDNQRSLLFVKPDGREITETTIDVRAPHVLQTPYTRHMFVSYLLVPRPNRVLIVGLGGGAMVHFLRHYSPNTSIDVVEIDEAVVRIAKRHFGVVQSDAMRIHTGDIFEFVTVADGEYDVVYMDAFLPPSMGTDPGGMPLRLKTGRFYSALKRLLVPGGVVVFNAIDHDALTLDLATIAGVFTDHMVFAVPDKRNRVVLASLSPLPTYADLRGAANRLDAEMSPSFRFVDLLRSGTDMPEPVAPAGPIDRLHRWWRGAAERDTPGHGASSE